MAPSELPEILKAIKATLKARGLTYRDLAALMGMPESTVKKVLTSKDLSFRRVEAICRALDLDLGDVLSTLSSRPVQTVTFTSEQEELFEAEPHAFELYWSLVIERATSDIAAQRLGLSGPETFHYLHRLDQVGLIELHAENAVRLPKIRPIRWNLTTAFVRTLITHWSARIIQDAVDAATGDDCFLSVQYFQLQQESYDELLTSLREIEADFAKRTARELGVWQKNLLRVRAVFAVAKGSFLEDNTAR